MPPIAAKRSKAPPFEVIATSFPLIESLCVPVNTTVLESRTVLSDERNSIDVIERLPFAAKIAAPSRMVVSFNGDGCFLMNGQELATAIQYGAAVIFIVVNNGIYGTIRMHQEREYPGRVSGTGLSNPDFAALARAYGAHGETVASTADFEAAFERALAAGKPALIEIRLAPEVNTPALSLSQIRAAAMKRQGG